MTGSLRVMDTEDFSDEAVGAGYGSESEESGSAPVRASYESESYEAGALASEAIQEIYGHKVLPEDAREYELPGSVSGVTDEKLAEGTAEIQKLHDEAVKKLQDKMIKNLHDESVVGNSRETLKPEETKLVLMNIFRHFIFFACHAP